MSHRPVLDVVQQVLADAGEPLHYREITERALDNGWATDGKTPEASINAQLAVDIKRRGAASRFRRVGRGIFALNNGHAVTTPSPAPRRRAAPAAPSRTLSFTEAAAEVLKRFGNNQPMHYRDITEKAQQLGFIATSGRTPEASMYSSVIQEIQRRQKRSEQPRFHMHGKGMIGLTAWMPKGLSAQIETHNRKIRKELHARLTQMDPGDFEELIGQLLAELGFDKVEVTQRRGDGGIDVRGTLVVGDVIRTSMAVQVKRWKPNIQAPIVREVRGSLGAHEQGLIITTSDFGRGAIEEAQRADATPIGLMNGQTLVGLLVEHGIGVKSEAHDLLTLTEVNPEAEE